MDVVEYLGSIKTSIVGPILEMRINYIFTKVESVFISGYFTKRLGGVNHRQVITISELRNKKSSTLRNHRENK